MKRPADAPRPRLQLRGRGRELLNLVLFFIADRLQADAPWPGLLLAAYFGAAAAGLPLAWPL